MLNYTEALNLLVDHAKTRFDSIGKDAETVTLGDAVGRVLQRDVFSPESSPSFDSSSMDGYVLDSKRTATATASNPVMFQVKGTIAAGDPPPEAAVDQTAKIPICMEIMTGAPFPRSPFPDVFDACVRIEDTADALDRGDGNRYILITKPVNSHQNRRFAGSDVRKEALLIPARSVMRPQDVMVLATVGFREVRILRRVRVAVLSTGSELVSWTCAADLPDGKIRDSNGPFIEAALRQAGADVDCLSIVEDSPQLFAEALRDRLSKGAYDVVISTGGVSAGKFDYVREGVMLLGGNIRFHRVAVRPGKPIMFAEIPRSLSKSARNGVSNHNTCSTDMEPSMAESTAFFGLPGNPIAAAATFRFFVVPYLRRVSVGDRERPLGVEIVGVYGLEDCTIANGLGPLFCNASQVDLFRHAVMRSGQNGLEAFLIADQSPGKVRPWLHANCWVFIPHDVKDVNCGDRLKAYPIDTSKGFEEARVI